MWHDGEDDRPQPVHAPQALNYRSSVCRRLRGRVSPEERAEWLAVRHEYSKLINIDSPGPDVTVPVKLFVGIDVDHDERNGTVSLSQYTYVAKLRRKYGNRVTMNEMPTPTSKARREAFETMEKGDEEGIR